MSDNKNLNELIDTYVDRVSSKILLEKWGRDFEKFDYIKGAGLLKPLLVECMEALQRVYDQDHDLSCDEDMHKCTCFGPNQAEETLSKIMKVMENDRS